MESDQVLSGRYRLVEHVGVGGMSVVWRARDQLLNRDVAVKMLAGDASDPEARARMLVEAQVCAHLWHPNVASVYDYGESAGPDGEQVPYVVMELLPGLTLGQRLAEGPLPVRIGMRVCADVAAGLAAAHAQNIVHRDVKPGNVVLTPSGAKIVDFGIAAYAGEPETEVDGELLGTPTYVAPERLAREAVTPASDVYALGVLIHRVLARRLPWPAETPSQIVNAHAFVQATPLPPLADVPWRVAKICDRCLDKDPRRRPLAAEVAEVLAEAAGANASRPAGRSAVSFLAAPVLAAPVLAALALDAAATRELMPQPVPMDELAAGSQRLEPSSRRRPVAALAVVTLVLVLAALVAFLRPGPGADLRATIGTAGPTIAGATVEPTSASPAVPVDQPVGPPASPAADVPVVAGPPPTGSTPTPLDGTSVLAMGGEIRVRCLANLAEVLAVAPAPGYQIKTDNRGPADEVRVTLHSAANDSDIKVTCVAGAPQPQVKESKKQS
jgi:hypothetical protein